MPRTLEQLESQLPAGDVPLSDEVLDRLDEVVAGDTVDRAHLACEPRAIRHARLRRISGS